jgi:hypothetical protein
MEKVGTIWGTRGKEEDKEREGRKGEREKYQDREKNVEDGSVEQTEITTEWKKEIGNKSKKKCKRKKFKELK